MIVHVYDLTGSATCSVFETSAENGKPQETSSHSINRVLIIPETHTNRAPYLQHNEQPILQDLVNEKGEFSYRNAWHWQEYFHDLEEGGNAGVISHFFEALSQESYFGQADRNIILIPDNFSPNTQEYILRNCRLSREKTYLLWRSVATAIGYRKRLQDAKVKNGEEIAIIDIQACETQVSILTMLEHEGKLIPQRRAYKSKSNAYPYHQGEESSITYTNASGKRSDFYNSTFYGKEGDCVVWNDMHRRFEVQSFKPDDGPTLIIPYYCIRSVQEETCCIQIGGSSSALPYHQKMLMDRDNKHMLYGAAKFGVLAHTNKILYFDQCDGLYLVVGNRREQRYRAKELIPLNKYSPGGKPVIGEMNEDCYLEANSPAASFYLLTGEREDLNSTPLKLYTHEFEVGREHAKSKLKLYPSIIPGQGIAQVRVESDIIQGDVHLDLLKMNETKETINTLKMPLRWPIAIPGVVAQTSIWLKRGVQLSVRDYIRREIADGSMFAQSQWPNRFKDGEERFERWNVFGSREGRERPKDPSFDFDNFFSELSLDYATCSDVNRKNNLLGMISWTYCRSDELFQEVKRDCIHFIQGHHTDLDSRRLFTACANLFYTDDELKLFFNAFSDFIRSCVISEETRGLASWTRALSELLINHPHMLSLFSDNLCSNTIKNLGKLIKHVRYEPNKLRFSLKCILYLLTRRKYNYDFYSSNREIEFMKYALSYLSPLYDMRIIVEKFLDGTATIDDIPFD